MTLRPYAFRPLVAGAVLAAVVGTAGCADEFLRQDRSPVTLVIDNLQATSGSTGNTGGTLQSDVLTNGGIFNDSASVTVRAIMKNQGSPENPVAPSATNAVTITRYRVSFRRSDGRNVPGVDVPQPFDSATTFTVQAGGVATQGFELIRHTAKIEPPLATLAGGLVIISTIADVTFFARDQAGNELTATGQIGVLFGDFADPEDE
jgi:hypothetical protein